MVVNISRILCPVDLSVVSRHALDHAYALAKWYEAHLTVLYVCPAPPVPVPPTDLAGDVTVLPRQKRHRVNHVLSPAYTVEDPLLRHTPNIPGN